MEKHIKILTGVVFMIGLTSCSTTINQGASGWQQNLDSIIPYKIGKTHGVSVQSAEGLHILQGKDKFRLILQPAQGDSWNMESVSVLGLMLKNTGETEMVLDLMLCNDGATGWSNSSLGRTVVKSGEKMPLGVALCHRSKKRKEVHPAYLRMSGRPNGHFSHWHTIDSTHVKSLVITSVRKGDHAFELAQMFPLQKMDDTYLEVLPFIDQYGQYIHKEWPGKVHSDRGIIKGIKAEKKLEKELGEPADFTKYGGWKNGPKFEATGFFYTKKYKGRWWFVDPEGYLFWSYGVDCAGILWAGQTLLERDPAVFRDLPAREDPEFGRFYTKRDVEYKYKLLEDVPHFDFTQANLYRKYGKDWSEKYLQQDIQRLKYCHLNTIGAWSDDALAAAKKVPYTAMIHYEYAFAAQKLPDPFDPETRAGLRKSIHEYPVNFKDDSWCLGAFVNNELHWNNNAKGIVSDILSYETENTEVKKTFRDWLKEKYTTVAEFNTAWKTSLSDWDDLLKATDRSIFKNAKGADCSALTTLFANAFFKMVKEELNRYSPSTLYLGCRFHVGPGEIIKTAAKYVDVISTNLYSYSPHVGRYSGLGKPILITEFHFVNTAGNSLGGGLRAAQSAQQQGRLFRVYITEAVKHPEIIGAHWFQWRDQNVGGRFDGENYDVGFFDVADIPNEDLIRAAGETGRTLYNSAK